MSAGDLVFLLWSGPAAVASLAALAATLWTLARVRGLGDVELTERASWPRVSIIVPACNEAGTLGPALESLLAQSYPSLQLVAIDDRSTDETGAIIDTLAARDSRVIALHVAEVPEGWLGKLNAMACGVARSDGEWLLFADADVQFSPDALRKAVSLCLTDELDLLTALPEVLPAGFLGDATINVTGLILASVGRLPKVRDPRSAVAAGVGAFILVRRVAFDRTPGLAWLKLEVADDMGLGLMLKKHGARCEIVQGRGELRLQWYDSFRDMAAKMQKNYFAILARFSVWRALGSAAVIAALALAPLACVIPHTRALDVLPLVTTLALTAGTLGCARWLRRPMLPALFPQVGLLGQAYMLVRSAIVGARIGGIAWRGKVYPTRVLRAEQRVKL